MPVTIIPDNVSKEEMNKTLRKEINKAATEGFISEVDRRQFEEQTEHKFYNKCTCEMCHCCSGSKKEEPKVYSMGLFTHVDENGQPLNVRSKGE